MCVRVCVCHFGQLPALGAQRRRDFRTSSDAAARHPQSAATQPFIRIDVSGTQSQLYAECAAIAEKSGKTPPKTLFPTKTRFEPQRLEGRLKSLLFSQLYQFAVVMGVLSVAAQTLCECSWVCVWKNRVFATCPSTNFVRVDVGVCVGVCVCVCVSFCACMCFCLLGK